MSDTLVARFLAGLPYELTTAQRRALAVIVADMAGPFPMHRLLQGDVGSGKTVVALAALLAAVQSGHQGALDGADRGPGRAALRRRARAARGSLEGPGGMAGGDVRVELLTSRVKGKARTAVLEGLASGAVGIVVGTHALLDRGGGVRVARRGGHRRAAPLRGRAAGDAAGQGHATGTRTCW